MTHKDGRKLWPQKPKQPQPEGDVEPVDLIDCSHLSDTELNRLDAILALQVWDEPRYEPLVEDLMSKVRFRPRTRPRLSARFRDLTQVHATPSDKRQAAHILREAGYDVSGIDVPDDVPDNEPKRSGTVVKLRQRLRKRRKRLRQAAAEPEGKHHTPAAHKTGLNRDSPHTDSAAASSETPAAEPNWQTVYDSTTRFRTAEDKWRRSR